MKLIKKLMILWACLIFAFTTMFVVPQQKAHAILPALVAGQFVKKGATKALASVLVRQGAKSGTVVTMERAVKIAGSRMTPQQYAAFTGALGKGVKSLDNKYVKIILGAELAGALAMLTGDMADMAVQNQPIEYNEELIDNATGQLSTVAIPMDLQGTSIDNRKRFFLGSPILDFPGLVIAGKNQVGAFYPYLGATFPDFDSTSTPTLEEEPFGSQGVYRTWTLGYVDPQPTYLYDVIGITGIDVYLEPGPLVRVNFYGQTMNPPATYKHFLNPSNGNPGHLFMGYSNLSTAEWNDYYVNYFGADPFMETAGLINDFSKDETFVETYPLTSPSQEVPNELEFQIPNPDYWDLPGMKEAYYEQLQNFPGQTTVIDPNNYPKPGEEEEKDIYGDGLPYSPGTFPQPTTPTDPGTDPGTEPGGEPLPPAEGTVPGTPPGTTPGTPYIPPGEGCTQALQIPRFLPLVNTLSESFPFSIPFDLYDGFQALFSEMGSARPNFKYDVNFNGEVHSWNITIPSYFDDWKPFTDSILIFIFDVGIIYAFFRFMKGGS